MGQYASKLGAVRVEREIGGRTLVLETGRIARQASSAVFATYGESTVLATVVRAPAREGLDFFPLTVDYREKLPAAGKFPGGFRKREGAPNEKEILTMRMIDRPIRPLFPDGFVDEIQVQVWVMSHDGENDTDVLAGTAASAALAISDAPFEGPTATVRVARIHTDDGPRFVVNPTVSQMDYSDLDLVLAGHKDGVNMIEVGAAEITEADMVEAIRFGQSQIAETLAAIEELAAKAGREKRVGDLSLPDPEVVAKVKAVAEAPLTAARRLPGKQERNDAVDALRARVLDEHFPLRTGGTYEEYAKSARARAQAVEAFRTLEKKITRRLIVESGVRADGRKFDEIRPIECEVGVFARTHGSALFQRGETQSLVSCTLGTARDEQIVDGLIPEYSKKFTLHYNFPPFSTGEAKRIMGPGRREIGHGALAERSLMAILPSPDVFPYTIRVVSDITESNGSSSMASVCGGCLALMDAGVPITATCAGISVGRFTDDSGGREVFVTDIIGEEDFFGDMDFKVSGTRGGITGIQLDLKARGLNVEQITRIFEQARVARLRIIDRMEACIARPRESISVYAPRLITLNIHPEKIGKLIGPGGKTIRALQDKHGVTIDVEDDGTVMVSAPNGESIDAARAEIEALCEEIKVGTVYNGKVISVKDFGAFIELAPGTDGMCHISELAEGYVKSVTDVVKVGDIVKVKVILVDEQGRIKLSRKQAMSEQASAAGV
ncbi:MAG: polyribonucleotide nucleotidyltransferase [Leptolyngbya sp. PLA2]|nr:polyribonucleotide nucleotidyltransferase [Leptolyngbya sp.]MCE7970777.1 polyribonucleotide nucleotidyltransferase [Leptolyngbya sp. PL-A2]MCQ3939932.1 polyribonucleotide nucleotidyltransferase [cyanobacterium CYA1]MCZ7633558.1 polyribonucleotide nucleotidyltransferase [Phycisphaerales bacterium]MDL1903323.1 polyribonucleotide nucleotidyltransferase [Synechococcales cyanobacterium CNB]GIK18018.1 MAG: polyribonucleotide nucleotidyltransferase [Planctomycetota bacterium]